MKLSIITVNFNNRDGLQRTIDSVVSQTWRDFEWIIIDGGSTDGSKELIEKYQSHFAYWCSELDKGVYDAMNKGIDKASGEWINFMNSGDCFVNGRVLSEVFEGKTYLGDVKVLLGDTILSYPFGYFYMSSKYPNGSPNFCHQSSFTRLTDMKGVKFDTSYKYVADRAALQEITEKGGVISFLPIPVSVYEAGSGLSQGTIFLHIEGKRMERRNKGWSYYKWLIKLVIKDFMDKLSTSTMRKKKRERDVRRNYKEINILDYCDSKL